MNTRTFAAALAGFLASVSFAQPSSVEPTTIDAPSCVKWVGGPSDEDKQWLLGYMSGLNVLHMIAAKPPKNPIDTVAFQSALFVQVAQECQQMPRGNVAMAAFNVFLTAVRESERK